MIRIGAGEVLGQGAVHLHLLDLDRVLAVALGVLDPLQVVLLARVVGVWDAPGALVEARRGAGPGGLEAGRGALCVGRVLLVQSRDRLLRLGILFLLA